MHQLTQKLKTGELKITEAPVPVIGNGQLLVKNHFSLISAGTEGSTVKTARKGYHRQSQGTTGASQAGAADPENPGAGADLSSGDEETRFLFAAWDTRASARSSMSVSM